MGVEKVIPFIDLNSGPANYNSRESRVEGIKMNSAMPGIYQK